MAAPMDSPAPAGSDTPSHNTPSRSNTGGALHKHHQLNCERCRKRKTKCDRAEGGCTACQRAGVTCIVVDRPRLPRGRNGGRKKQDVELRTRLARLEDLVKTFAPSSVQPQSNGQANSDGVNVKQESPHAALQSHTSSSSGDTKKYMGSAFWESLSSEINGISEVLDDSEEEDYGTPGSGVPCKSATHYTAPQVDLFIMDPDSFLYNPALLDMPDTASAAALCDVFIYRFLTMLPVLHGPSLRHYITGQGDYLDLDHDDPAVKALSFAVFYAAIVTLQPDECIKQFNVDRQSALRRYRFATELSLAQADLHRSTELTTLQAMMIYLMALRTEDSSRKMWSLFGLALRTAHALRLHNDEINEELSPFEREMRRRVWHNMRRIDILVSLDRGTYPCLPVNTMVKLPLNLDDSNFDFHTEGPLHAQIGYTCVAMFLSCIDIFSNATNYEFGIIGDAYHAKMGELQAPRPANTNTIQAYADYPTSLKYATDRYLQYCDPNIDLQLVNLLISKLVILQKVLLSVMPMRRSASHTSHVDDVVFSQAIELLEIGQELATNPRLMPWKWSSRVHWHSFGIVLAKLCVEPNSKLAGRAWNVVEAAFIEYGKKVADSEKGMLWKPLEKLMFAARQAKAKLEGRVSSMASPSVIQEDISNVVPPLPQQSQQQAMDFKSSYPSTLQHTAIPNGNLPNDFPQNTALTTDFDMLSFQDSMQAPLENLSMTTNDPVWSGWDWSSFVDDMNTNYLAADDFADISFEPTLPAYQRNFAKKWYGDRNLPAY